MWKVRALDAIALDLPPVLIMTAVRKVVIEHKNVTRLLARSSAIRSTVFNLNAFSDHQSLRDFRFKKCDVGRICDMVDWSGVSSRSEYYCHPITAICFTLQRLATTVRWVDMERKFGMHASQMSEIYWENVTKLVESYGYVLNMRGGFLRERAAIYAESIRDNNAPLPNCVGFIDCSNIRICRPGGEGANQRSCYSGHKRVHCLKYQTLTTPDGLMFALFGPEVGRRHDVTLYRSSQWESVLRDNMYIAGIQYYIYGDSAYLLRPWMQLPYFRDMATAEQVGFITAMSKVRVAVEHNYKDLKQYWISQDLARNLKVRQAPIAVLYKASAILLNFHACIYKRGQIREQFNVAPPSLADYLAAQ